MDQGYLPEERLKKYFDTSWPKLEKKIQVVILTSIKADYVKKLEEISRMVLGLEVYQYVRDAEARGDQELTGFFRDIQEEERRRADRAKQILARRVDVTLDNTTVTLSSPNGPVIPRFLRGSAGPGPGPCYRIARSVPESSRLARSEHGFTGNAGRLKPHSVQRYRVEEEQ